LLVRQPGLGQHPFDDFAVDVGEKEEIGGLGTERCALRG
jgi:hypothetical protein